MRLAPGSEPEGTVVIEERAVRRLAGVRVAAGNLWDRAREGGSARQPSAQLFVGEQAPVRVWAGDTLEVGGIRWTVQEVQLGPGTTGRITLVETP